MDWTIRGRGKKFCLFSEVSRPALGPTQPPIQSVGINRPDREADHSPTIVRRSRMVELYLNPSICLHGAMLNKLSTWIILPVTLKLCLVYSICYGNEVVSLSVT
jgi:hypothetical protein